MTGRRRGGRLGGWLLAAALLAAGCGGGSNHAANPGTTTGSSTSPTTTTSVLTPNPPGVGIHKIRHVVIIMQENRSFDSYFGTYPGADGIPGLAGNPGTVPCVPNPGSGGCVRPFHDEQDRNLGGPHSAAASVADINGGKMDGFVTEQERGMSGCAQTFNPACGSGGGMPDVMGYHTGADIPNYWTYARDFVLQDHMFESVASWSLPAHLYMVSEWSAHCTLQADPIELPQRVESPEIRPTSGAASAIRCRPPNYAWTDLTYLLHKNDVSWGYYVYKGTEPDCDNDAACRAPRSDSRPRRPGSGIRCRTSPTSSRTTSSATSSRCRTSSAPPRTARLPAVSWVTPNGTVSEHPPGLISAGQTYVTGLINAIMRSPDWTVTAIFLAWDDWGGFYDHVSRRASTRTATACVSRPGDQPLRQAGLHRPSDAELRRLRQIHRGRLPRRTAPRPPHRRSPRPPPDVREDALELGNLIKDFDFHQAPRQPVLLNVTPEDST